MLLSSCSNGTFESHAKQRLLTSDEIDDELFQIEPKVPMDLLLLADPSIERIRQYIKDSYLFIAINDGKTIGAIIIMRMDETIMEQARRCDS